MSGGNNKTIEQVHHVGNLRWDAALEKWVPITADDLATTTGTVTADAGADWATSGLAKETGGNLALTGASTAYIAGKITANIALDSSVTAGNSTLSSILTELGAKTEPADTQITQGPADLVDGPTTLDALNETAETALSGYFGVSVTLVETSFTGTIQFFTSYDGGSNWQASYVFNAVGQLVGTTAGTGGTLTTSFSFPAISGASHVRVLMQAYTGGSVDASFRKTAALGMALPATGLNSGSAVPTSMQIGGQWKDVGNLLTPIQIRSGTQASSDYGVVTKPINVAGAPLFTKHIRAATPTVAQVGDSASSVTLLASNANRLGATIYNDSSAILYLKLGATASATSFTVILSGNGSGIGGYFEVPDHYTGIIDGIWASDAGGNAYVTELVV